MRYVAVAAFTAILALSAPVVAQEQPRIATLSANGTGSVSVVPDIAIVVMGVTTRAKTAREALDANNAELAKVIAAIQAEGVKDTDIGTSGFSVNPIYESKPRSASSTDPDLPVILGYKVSNSVRVTIRDIAASGALLDKVVTAGANQIDAIEFDVSDPQEPSDEALAAAIADANRMAKLMADAAGVRLVRILDVNASSGRPAFARMETRAMSDAVPIMPGERQVTGNANVTWEIAPK